MKQECMNNLVQT